MDENGNVDAPDKSTKRGTIKFINEKLICALDRCKISDRNAVYIIYAVAEALGHDPDELILNRTSIQDCRKEMREAAAKRIKEEFIVSDPNVLKYNVY